MTEVTEAPTRLATAGLIVGFDSSKGENVELGFGGEGKINEISAFELGRRLFPPDERKIPLTTYFSELISRSSGRNQKDQRLPEALEESLAPFSTIEQGQLFDLFSGFGLLASDLLNAVDLSGELAGADEVERREILVSLAAFNQQLAFAMAAASDLPADNPDRLYTEGFVGFFESLAQSSHNSASKEVIRNLISGARAQASLTNLLEGEGWMIVVPDWSNDEEIEKFDLRGVDFVAVSPDGDVVLIDAKSRRFNENNQLRLAPTIEEGKISRQDNEIRQILVSFFKNSKELSFREHCQKALGKKVWMQRCRILMPGDESVIGLLGRFEPEHFRANRDIVVGGLKKLCR